MKKEFNKNGVYLFAIKNLSDEVEIYWDKEYEYDIYYFKTKDLYNENKFTILSDREKKFFIKTFKGLLPKDLKNAKYIISDTDAILMEEIYHEEIMDNAPKKLDCEKYYCVIIELEHIDSLVFDMKKYIQKTYEFKTEKEQQDFIITGENTGKLIENKERVLHFNDLNSKSNIAYLVSHGTNTKLFEKDYLLDEEIFNTYGMNEMTKVIFYPSLDTFIFNCHEDHVKSAIDNLSLFTTNDLEYDKFIQEVKRDAIDCKNFNCQYIGKSTEINPENPYTTSDEVVSFINTYLKLDRIYTLEEIDVLNNKIYFEKMIDIIQKGVVAIENGSKKELEIIKTSLQNIKFDNKNFNNNTTRETSENNKSDKTLKITK